MTLWRAESGDSGRISRTTSKKFDFPVTDIVPFGRLIKYGLIVLFEVIYYAIWRVFPTWSENFELRRGFERKCPGGANPGAQGIRISTPNDTNWKVACWAYKAIAPVGGFVTTNPGKCTSRTLINYKSV